MMRKGQVDLANRSSNTNQFASSAHIDTPVIYKKRKSGPQIKFYAVKVGYRPGIYLTWEECEQNIVGFKNASFKSFPDREEAESYIAGRESSTRSSQATPRVEKFYGVASGRIPGVYTDWAIAQEQIKGWKGPKYKKFATKFEAEEFVQSGGSTQTKAAKTVPLKRASYECSKSSAGLSEDEKLTGHQSKRPRKAISNFATSINLGLGKEGERDGIDLKDVVSPKLIDSVQTGALRIYTDGSSLSNGKDGARAGLGVYFGAGDPRNLAERLPGQPQTNQRAELAAILRALELSPPNHEVHIVTDSQYSISCVTVWHRNWERNSWQTATKQPVLNKDLIQGILARINDREAYGAKTTFFWIKGHSNDQGNEAADRLAVLGAQKALMA